MPDEESPVYMFDADDPEMEAAVLRARETFKYIWRELYWEYRRIIAGLDVAAVKLPFADGDLNEEGANVEQMWVNEVDFDGREIHGTLINSPNWLKSVQVGDEVSVPIGGISDWMYVVAGEVCGALTVDVMRARMGARERRQHDDAWGLEFGDPAIERLFPSRHGASKKSSGLLGRLFGKKHDPPSNASQPVELPAEHPMGINMAELYTEQLAKEPEVLQLEDEDGWLQLHHHALAGNTMAVELFLQHGADPNALTPEGVSPEALARVLGWDALGDLLAKAADGR